MAGFIISILVKENELQRIPVIGEISKYLTVRLVRDRLGI